MLNYNLNESSSLLIVTVQLLIAVKLFKMKFLRFNDNLLFILNSILKVY